MNKHTIVLNLFGGPGISKSTMAAGIFAKLKWNKIHSELINEYAKELVWESSFNKLKNQVYVFAKQHNKQYTLNGKVNVIITDSPLVLTIYYDKNNTSYLEELAISEFNKYNNFNILLNRVVDYDSNGRMQTLEQSMLIDIEIKELLDKHNIEYTILDGNEKSIDIIVKQIIELVNN